MENRIADIQHPTSREEVEDNGLVIANVVGSFQLDFELDLNKVSDIPNTEYSPDIYQNLVYDAPTSESTHILVFRSGFLFIVGAKDEDEIVDTACEFIDWLECIGYQPSRNFEQILIQNILATGSLDSEINIPAICAHIGFESIEYDPDTFPGMFLKTSVGPTVTLYRTGKFTIGGAKNYADLLASYDELIEALPEEVTRNSQ
jgi:transcription initiation factor TFIID TATA-box-binding protein